MKTYLERVLELEAEGCCTSDAQAIVDAEDQRFEGEPGDELPVACPVCHVRAGDACQCSPREQRASLI